MQVWPAFRRLAPRDFAGGRIEVGRAVHDAGAFAAQFERYGCQVCRRLLHHRASEGRSAREEDVVETILQQFGCLGMVAVENRHVVRGKYLAEDVPDEAAGTGRGCGGFQRHAVPCGERPHQRVEGELEGIVPRRHDKHHPLRFPNDAARGGEEEERGRHPPAAGPALQMPQLVAYFGQHNGRLADIRLFRRFVQVGVQGFRYLLLVCLYGLLQSAQVLFAECGFPRVPFGVEGPHRVEPFPDGCCHGPLSFGPVRLRAAASVAARSAGPDTCLPVPAHPSCGRSASVSPIL